MCQVDKITLKLQVIINKRNHFPFSVAEWLLSSDMLAQSSSCLICFRKTAPKLPHVTSYININRRKDPIDEQGCRGSEFPAERAVWRVRVTMTLGTIVTRRGGTVI